jgi:hypothetical protein
VDRLPSASDRDGRQVGLPGGNPHGTRGEERMATTLARHRYDAFIEDVSLYKTGARVDVVLRALDPDDPRRRYVSEYCRVEVLPADDADLADLLCPRTMRGRSMELAIPIRIVERLGTFEPKASVVKC